MRLTSLMAVIVYALPACILAFSVLASDSTSEPKETPPEFTKAYLSEVKNQKAGEEIWVDQCRHCHGASAYPGKGPKLKPYRYKPLFVFERITNGFRKMPAWKDVYTKEERMALVSYIMSDDFSP